MSKSDKSIWEKISILTSFFGGLTALIVTIAGLVTVQVESSRTDSVVTKNAIRQKVGSSTDTAIEEPIIKHAAKGWAYIGQTKNYNVSIGDEFTFKRDTNIRSDYPRFPFYQFAPIIDVVPKGTRSEILDIRTNVGARNFTWIFIEAERKEGGT